MENCKGISREQSQWWMMLMNRKFFFGVLLKGRTTKKLGQHEWSRGTGGGIWEEWSSLKLSRKPSIYFVFKTIFMSHLQTMLYVIAMANGANRIFLKTKWKTYGQLRSSQLNLYYKSQSEVKFGAKFQNLITEMCILNYPHKITLLKSQQLQQTNLHIKNFILPEILMIFYWSLFKALNNLNVSIIFGNTEWRIIIV